MNPHIDLRQLAVRREAPADSLPRLRPRLLTRYLIPGVVLLGFAGIVGWAARDALLPAQPVTVVPVLTTRAELRQDGLPLFQAAGWVEPRPTATMVPVLAEGIVERLLVVEGQAVEAGEVVATLVDADARLGLQAAEADLRQRQAEAEALVAKAEADLAFLPFQLQAAEARQKLARADLESKKMTAGALPVLTLHRAESELAVASAAVDELKLRKQRLEREAVTLRGLRDGSLEKLPDERPRTEPENAMVVAMTRIRQGLLAIEAARLRLQRMTVRAPINGRVLALLARPGSRLSGMGTPGHPDASSVVSLYDPNRLQVRADVRFEDLPGVISGQAVRIESPAVRGVAVEGEVLTATSIADIQKNTLQVKVAVKQPPPLLRPDMLVQVTFLAMAPPEGHSSETERLRLLIPRQLVETVDGGSKVWVADLVSGLARRRPVKLGSPAGDLIEVVDGLQPTDKLVASGRDVLHEGKRVRVTGEEPVSTTGPLGSSGAVRPSRLPGASDAHKGKH